MPFLFSERDEKGNYRRYRYNQYGQVVPHVNNGTQIEYNHWNRPILKRDGNGNETRYEYDIKGRLILEIDAIGRRTSRVYDPEGNLTANTDSLGHAKVFTYQVYNLNTRLENENGHCIDFQYDSEGNIQAITNENKEQHRFEYGPDDLLKKSIGFDGQIHQYGYDPVGNVRRIQVPGGNLVLSHDRANRLTRVTGTEINGSICWTEYVYDKAGRPIEATNENGTVAFEYDALGNITKETTADRVTEREYDPVGNLTAIKTDGSSITYVYDENHRVAGFILPNEEHITYVRDAAGFPKERHLPGGAFSRCDHDAAGRLTCQEIICQDETLIRRDYRYDANGRLSALTDKKRGTKSYEYDPAGRLVRTAQSHGETELFEYDPAGNLLRKNRQACATYDEGNRQTSFNDAVMAYDSRGNLLRKTGKNGTCRYGYNLFNQLIWFTGPDNIRIEFAYDALGRRITKKTPQGEVRSHWNLLNLAREETNGRCTEYVYYPDTFLPLCVIRDNKVYYFQTDHLGSPQEIIDADGKARLSGPEIMPHPVFARLMKTQPLTVISGPWASFLTGKRACITMCFDIMILILAGMSPRIPSVI